MECEGCSVALNLASSSPSGVTARMHALSVLQVKARRQRMGGGGDESSSSMGEHRLSVSLSVSVSPLVSHRRPEPQLRRDLGVASSRGVVSVNHRSMISHSSQTQSTPPTHALKLALPPPPITRASGSLMAWTDGRADEAASPNCTDCTPGTPPSPARCQPH